MTLVFGTLRYHLHSLLILPATVGAELGIVSDQVVALAAGRPVTFPSGQLASLFPGGASQHPALPVGYGASAFWTLTDDTLAPTP